MVREGRVLISSATDPDFGSNYYVTAYEVGAQVSAAWSGGSITVDAGHGFATNDKFIVLSEFPGVTKYRTVTGTGATSISCASVSVSIGDILINLGQDTGPTEPFYDGNGLAIYTDMDYGNQAANNTVQTDSTGRYRYYYNNIPIWELVRSAISTPFTAYLDTGLSGIGGPASSTDNAVVRFDGTTGSSIQNSVVTIADSTGNMAGVGTLAVGGALTASTSVSVGTTLTVTGTSTVAAVNASGTVAMAGAATVGTTLGVTGAVTMAAAASVGTTLTVTGATSLNSTLAVSGDETVSGYAMRSVAAAVTASTTQTQAGGTALTKDINNIATVANANDTVTLPTAAAGMSITIFNNGASTLKIYPASGDNLGAGVDTSTTLLSGKNRTYVSYNTTNWEVAYETP